MNDANFEPGPDEARVLERIRSAAPPLADAAFRSRLKQEFVSGEIPERHAVISLPEPRRTHRVRWIAAMAAAASITVVALALNQAPRWVVMPSAGSGTLLVNGVPHPIEDAAGLARHLRPGARLVLQSAQDLDLVSSGLLAMQLAPGTEAVLPAPPGRWFGRVGRGSVSRGHLRLTTGRRFDGSRLSITTPDATVQVTGTTLAVIAEPHGTCVCVLEGTAHVRPHKGSMTPVTPGTRCEVARGERESHSGEIRVAERPKLLDLRDRLKSVMD
jgi:hypothetical protein